MLTEQQKNKLIMDMCFTTRHDFGLDKPDNAQLSSGLTVSARMLLVQQMTQLVNNCVIPMLEDIRNNRERTVQEIQVLHSLLYSDAFKEKTSISDRIRELEATL